MSSPTSNSPNSRIDLHTHTTFSDGKLTPTQLVRLLAERGLEAVAITDHDSTEGLDEALAVAQHCPGLRVIPGIEISADHPTDAKADVHVLGYFLDYHDAAFQQRLSEFREGRDQRGYVMVQRLAEVGYPVDWERVKEIAGDAGVGRPHVAQAMVERRYIGSIKEAFNGLLDDGGIAFVDRPHISMPEATRLIQSVGGVAVLAHPLYVPQYESLLPNLREMGFVGFEVHYGEFLLEQRDELLRLAEQHGLLPCGGSDYHAMGHEGEALPGDAGPPREVFERLEGLARARAK